MSAIAGILWFAGNRPDPGLIHKLTGVMRRRGPDEQTHWSSGGVALGHCMLRATPESLDEHQPASSPDGVLTMVWDGRLDNREELQRLLSSAGAKLRNNSDAEIALQAFRVWGADCPARLLGDFAFAVWDAGRNSLFCARDHMGAKPLFHTQTECFFAFASEEEALSELPGIGAKPNEEFVAAYLLPDFRDIDRWQSWTEKIRLLPAAHSRTVFADGGTQERTYWQLEEGREDRYASDEECRQAFLAVFEEAVRCRMRSLGPVSAMVSGGLDSAGIVAMSKRVLQDAPEGLHTYSAISDDPDTCVETQCIHSLTQDLGSDAHHVSVPSFTGMLDAQDLAEVASANAHPLYSSILLPEMMCFAAQRGGHRVMLYGGCGDLTMDVPNRYIARLMRDGQWRDAWRECIGASTNNTYLRGAAPIKILLQNLWTAYVPAGMRDRVRRLRDRSSANGAELRHSMINRGFAQELKLLERIRAGKRTPPSTRSLQREHIELLESAPGIASVLTSCDRIAGRHGMEARDPWGDRRVVEFFLRLPLRQKIRNGWTKYLVRTSFAEDLAPQVRWRLGKEHLGWNFVCRLQDESRDLIGRTMDVGLAGISRYVDVEFARNQFVELGKSPSNSSRLNVFRVMTLSLWAGKALR